MAADMASYIFDLYRPHLQWYWHNPFGIHGLGHAARVLVWAEQVGQSLLERGRSVDIEVVRWAAALHDVGRLNDGCDRLHGQRSAEWARANVDQLRPSLSSGQMEQLAYVCAWHVPPDASAPDMTPELTCLKDADGLDRVRIHDLDPHQLRTRQARSLPDLAQQLFKESHGRPGDPWDAVRSCAIRLGLWR